MDDDWEMRFLLNRGMIDRLGMPVLKELAPLSMRKMLPFTSSSGGAFEIFAHGK